MVTANDIEQRLGISRQHAHNHLKRAAALSNVALGETVQGREIKLPDGAWAAYCAVKRAEFLVELNRWTKASEGEEAQP